MRLCVILSWVAASMSLASPPPPPGDLHVVVSSEFVYMARVRPTRQDWWLRGQQRALAVDGRLIVFREDLGLVWRIDTKAGTYTETVQPKPDVAPAAAAPPAVDMHTAGYSWEPEFDWTVKATGRQSTIAGLPCREFAAAGQADYAEAAATFWGCAPLAPDMPSPTTLVINLLRNDSTLKMIRDAAAREGGLWVLQAEETTEPAIAPTMILRVKVESLEVKPAPEGTFELAPTLKKAGR
jgi:hypothetical protein